MFGPKLTKIDVLKILSHNLNFYFAKPIVLPCTKYVVIISVKLLYCVEVFQLAYFVFQNSRGRSNIGKKVVLYIFILSLETKIR